MSSFEVEGLEKLSKQLTTLGPKLGSKFLRSALMAAATPVVKSAKANVPIGNEAHMTGRGKRATPRYQTRLVAPGFASRSVGKRSKLSRDKRTASVSIGVKGEAYYAVSFLELGTKYIPKQPWLTKALQKEQFNVIRKFSATLKKKIEQEAKKR